MEIKLGLATKKDVIKLCKYLEENSKDMNPSFLRKRVKYYIENNLIILAKDENKIIGHIFIQIKEKPSLGVAEIETTQVDSRYRKNGIGEKLVKQGVELTKKYFKKNKIKPRCVYLMTRSNNLPAIKIYSKTGFKQENKIGKIFKTNEPEEMIMTLFF